MNEITKVTEELGDICEGLDPSNEDENSLRETAERVIQLLSRCNLEKELNRTRNLAGAVIEFAEWQNTDYGDEKTRAVISRTLWGRVSDYVREAVQCEPPFPGSS